MSPKIPSKDVILKDKIYLNRFSFLTKKMENMSLSVTFMSRIIVFLNINIAINIKVQQVFYTSEE